MARTGSGIARSSSTSLFLESIDYYRYSNTLITTACLLLITLHLGCLHEDSNSSDYIKTWTGTKPERGGNIERYAIRCRKIDSQKRHLFSAVDLVQKTHFLCEADPSLR